VCRLSKTNRGRFSSPVEKEIFFCEDCHCLEISTAHMDKINYLSCDECSMH
jgi:hypothetical protein